MKLGERAYITFFTPQPEAMIVFCFSLGCRKITPTMFTDGLVVFEILPSQTPATALTYAVNDLKNKIEMGENLGIHFSEKGQNRASFYDPNELFISLVEKDAGAIPQPEEKPLSLCGTFYEISLETDDLDRSIVWWQNVGFKVTTRKQTWCTLDDGKIIIGLYQRGTCPHKFKNPSLTYFESDMEKRIAQLQSRGVAFVQTEQEIGMEGHAIAESPDGQYFFLFKV